MSNFSIAIEKDYPPSLEATLNVFLVFLGLGLGFFFLRFLGLGLGLELNKMDLAYVCMFRVLYEILYYTHVYIYVRILYNILYGMKVLIMYLCFPIFKLLPSSSPKLYLLHFKNVFWCLLNVNFCHNNFAKLHHSHMTLNRFEILLKHEKLCLLPSFKISAHLTS